MTEQFNDFRADSAIRPQVEEDLILRQDENIPTAVFVDSGGLGDFHVNNEAQEENAGRNKLFTGLAVAVLVGIGGAYGITQYMKYQPMVADSHLPQPTAPSNTAAMTPPPAAAAEATTSATPATAPMAPDVVKHAPVTKQAAIANTSKVMPVPRATTGTTMTPAPADQAAPATTPAPVQNQARNVPELVGPAPPASSVAGNPALNQQSVDQVPADQTAPADQAQTPAPQAASPDVTTRPASATPEPAPTQ